jgi:2-iminobutanoate/2-iminopropanoate deaminase
MDRVVFVSGPEDQPARIFLCVPAWPGPFDIEVDCIAVV